VGTEASGVIEISRLGYLTVAEKAFVQTAMAGDTGLSSLYALSSRIARETGKQQSEVFTDIANGSQGYLADYEGEIAEAASNMGSFQEKQTIIQATCLLIMRVDPKWTVEDSLDLHPDILEGLTELYADEDHKSLEAFERDEDKTEGSEGKS
jgi:hypothetical protein